MLHAQIKSEDVFLEGQAPYFSKYPPSTSVSLNPVPSVHFGSCARSHKPKGACHPHYISSTFRCFSLSSFFTKRHSTIMSKMIFNIYSYRNRYVRIEYFYAKWSIRCFYTSSLFFYFVAIFPRLLLGAIVCICPQIN